MVQCDEGGMRWEKSALELTYSSQSVCQRVVNIGIPAAQSKFLFLLFFSFLFFLFDLFGPRAAGRYDNAVGQEQSRPS